MSIFFICIFLKSDFFPFSNLGSSINLSDELPDDLGKSYTISKLHPNRFINNCMTKMGVLQNRGQKSSDDNQGIANTLPKQVKMSHLLPP